jgi:hypothetical protein
MLLSHRKTAKTYIQLPSSNQAKNKIFRAAGKTIILIRGLTPPIFTSGLTTFVLAFLPIFTIVKTARSCNRAFLH